MSVKSQAKVGSPTITSGGQSDDDKDDETSSQQEVEVTGKALADTFSKKDLLGYQDYVDALQDFIESSKTSKPITIGIDAPWGGGKTTIMHMLEKKLGPPKKLNLWQKENDEGDIESSLHIFRENFKTKAATTWRTK